MNKSRSNVFIMLNLIVSFFISACSSPREQVKIENGTFNINGKDVQLICGEMHYPRIPHEYWRDRLHRARAMGLNTVSAYVFWNFHERQPGVFDFTGRRAVCHSSSRAIRVCGMGFRRLSFVAPERKGLDLSQ